MDKKDISICTMTWARNTREERQLRESLEQLATLNISVFICDGGSTSDFIDFLKSYPHFNLVPGKASGVSKQVKAGMDAAYASGSPYILYTEPDKLEFFQHSLADFLRDAMMDSQSGILLASRTQEALETFPAFQRVTETAINNCCSEVIGKQLDYSYGPFILNRLLVQYLDLVKDDLGWGWRQYVFGIANRLGYGVSEIVGYFPCQVAERQDDPAERIYRIKQLSQSLNGLVQGSRESPESPEDRK